MNNIKSIFIQFWEFLKQNYSFLLLLVTILLIIYLFINLLVFITELKRTSNILCSQMLDENDLFSTKSSEASDFILPQHVEEGGLDERFS